MKRLIFSFALILSVIYSAFSFVKVTKDEKGWYFIDEDGNKFISRGVNKINIRGSKDSKTKIDSYLETVNSKYSDYYEWGKATEETLHSLGFNTVGAWSNINYLPNTYFIYIIYPGKNDWSSGAIDDYFSPNFHESTYQVINEAIKKDELVENKKLIGYCIGNELRWGIDWRKNKSIAYDYLNLKEDEYGKKASISFLQKYYNGDIKKLNREWFTRHKSWEEALSYTSYSCNTYKGKIAESRLLFYIADQYYKITTNIIREADPNHLILGSRFIAAAIPKSVIEASAYYCDVLSINYYQLILNLDSTLPKLLQYTNTDNYLSDFYQIGQKPILITEFGFRGSNKEAPSTRPFIFPVYYSEKARAKRFEKEIQNFMEKPYIIGYHVFKWMDQPKNGRDMPDKENNNCGIVNTKDEIYPILAESLKKSNNINH